MKKIKDGRGKVIEVQLDKGEQLMLMKENNKLLRRQTLDELAKISQEIGLYDNEVSK